MATVDVKYDTTPHDGTPGPPWDDFEERILGVAAGRTDDRGWSLADCANQTDEGGAAVRRCQQLEPLQSAGPLQYMTTKPPMGRGLPNELSW